MRLFTHPKLRITLEELNGISYVKEVWRGIFNTIVFRELILQSLEIYATEIPKIKHDNGYKLLLLADVRELELIREEDIEWLNNEVNLKYEKLGFTHQAVVAPITEVAYNIVEPYHSNAEKQLFITKVFKSEGEGMRWFIDALKNNY